MEGQALKYHVSNALVVFGRRGGLPDDFIFHK